MADAAATAGTTLVAVAGTHGKSTSTGWLVHLLVEAGRDPSAFVGALLDARSTGGVPATARWGSGDVFVVEADEYAGNFDPYLPDVAVLLNAEWDHPDVFADEAAVLAAFERWLRAAAGYRALPTLVANVGDPGAAAIAQRLIDWPGDLLVVALLPGDGDPDAERAALIHRFASATGPAEAIVGRLVRAEPSRDDVEPDAPSPDPASVPATSVPARRSTTGIELEIVGLPGGSVRRVVVGIPGRHNAENALAVAGAAAALGVDDDAILRTGWRPSAASAGGWS